MNVKDDPSNEEISELQALLERQEQEIVSLRDSRNSTIRKLHKAKLKVIKPSDEILKMAANASPMVDVFFDLLGEDKEAIGEIISTIIGVHVRVLNTVPQYSISNVGSMGVRLDNYSENVVEAELLEDSDVFGEKGTLVDIEVQNEKDDLDFRAFYNGASMIINKTPPKMLYKDLPHAIVICISSYDPYGDGEVLYENIVADKKTGKKRRSPLAEYFVNTDNLDRFLNAPDLRENKVAALMKVFRDADWYDEQFPAFSARKKLIHETSEGVMEVSKELQLIVNEQLKLIMDEQVKKVNEQAEQTRIADMRNVKEATGWTTQETLKALKIPMEQWPRYANCI